MLGCLGLKLREEPEIGCWRSVLSECVDYRHEFHPEQSQPQASF